MTEGTEILYLVLGLFVAVWLIECREAIDKAIARWWRGMNDKDAYLPAFITALLIWLIILWIRGDI